MVEERTRVGDNDSPVMHGDPTPTGAVYREGQYAPTVDELASDMLERAGEAGLIGALPIYDEAGEISPKKLEEWTPKVRGVHFDSEVPKFSSAVVYDVIKDRDWLTEGLGIVRIVAGSRQEQGALRLKGEVIIKAEYAAKNGFTGRLVVYPSFYKYVATPIVGRIPGRDSGLSIAAYAVLHALGHLQFAKLTTEGRVGVVAEMVEDSGWTKEFSHDLEVANYFGVENKRTSWMRDSSILATSEASKYSPADDFAEMFALYYANKGYLKAAFPKKFRIIEKVLGDN